MKILSLLVLCFLISAVYAVLGVDISDYTSSDAFHCMSQNGYSFGVVRGYCSFGGVDPNGVDNIENSIDGGMNHTDVYLFPCFPCGDPAGQVDALVDYIAGTGYGMVWLDIETWSWSSDLGTNQQFILALANELVNQGQSVGVYTNYYNWQSIVGLGWTGVSQYPLWYAHYDDWPSFGDFTPFGGWNEPSIKQFNGDVTVCGVNVDQDYYPL